MRFITILAGAASLATMALAHPSTDAELPGAFYLNDPRDAVNSPSRLSSIGQKNADGPEARPSHQARRRQLVVPGLTPILSPSPTLDQGVPELPGSPAEQPSPEEQHESEVKKRTSAYCQGGVDFPELLHYCREKVESAYPDYPSDYDNLMVQKADTEGISAAMKRGCDLERRMSVYCPDDKNEECREEMRAMYPELPADYPRNRLGMPTTGTVPAEYEKVCKVVERAR